MQTKNLDLLSLIERISEDVNSILGLAADSSQTSHKIKVEDKVIGTLNIKIDESLEQRIRDIVKESLAEQTELTSPISMPVSVSDDGRGCVGGVSIGQAPLKAYEETQDAKLDLISSLVALADVTKDEVTSVMLRFAVKQILQRDFKIDFDSGAQEEKPHIPQPKSI